MVNITTALTTVIWYGNGIQLSAASWRTNALIVRQVNGSGYSSFDPAPAQASFNSLTSVATGQVLIVESLASAYSVAGGYALDNGTPPVNLLKFGFPTGGTSSVRAVVAANEVGTYIADPANPAISSNALYLRNGTTVTLPITLALNDVLLVNLSNNTGADGFLTLIKQ